MILLSPYSLFSIPLSEFLPYIKAGTLLGPLHGFHFPVSVQVGTEVAVTAEAAAGIIAQQQHYEHPQGVFLKIGAGIGRMSVRIESAFVADTDTFPVETTAMRTDPF